MVISFIGGHALFFYAFSFLVMLCKIFRNNLVYNLMSRYRVVMIYPPMIIALFLCSDVGTGYIHCIKEGYLWERHPRPTKFENPKLGTRPLI